MIWDHHFYPIPGLLKTFTVISNHCKGWQLPHFYFISHPVTLCPWDSYQPLIWEILSLQIVLAYTILFTALVVLVLLFMDVWQFLASEMGCKIDPQGLWGQWTIRCWYPKSSLSSLLPHWPWSLRINLFLCFELSDCVVHTSILFVETS